MSGPNTNYDPVEVAALDPQVIEEAVQAALDAVAGAATLEELKRMRAAHQGDKSPLALANREIGALPPSAKADAGKRVVPDVREEAQRVRRALAELRASLDARVARSEAWSTTL